MRVLVVTEDGARLRVRMLERLAAPPEPIARLSESDQRTLHDILSRAMDG